MKLKIIVIDFEIPRYVKRWGVRIGLPVVLLGLSAVAYAGLPKIWGTGDQLTAADLNADFGYFETALNGDGGLVTRVTALEARPTVAAKYNTSSQAVGTSPAVLVMTTKEFDTTSSYSTSTGVFTVPASGYYQACYNFVGTFIVNPVNNLGAYVSVYKNSAEVSIAGYWAAFYVPNGAGDTPESSMLIRLPDNAGVTPRNDSVRPWA